MTNCCACCCCWCCCDCSGLVEVCRCCCASLCSQSWLLYGGSLWHHGVAAIPDLYWYGWRLQVAPWWGCCNMWWLGRLVLLELGGLPLLVVVRLG